MNLKIKKQKRYKLIGKIFLKILAVVLVIELNGSGIFSAGVAFAYFIDHEIGNTLFGAGTLDFSLNNDTWQLATTSVSLLPGDFVEKNIAVTNEGNLNFQYSVNFIKTAGDDDFCNGLDLIAKVDSVIIYNGKLIDFFATTTFTTSSANIWNFQAGLSSASITYFDKKCEFKFNFIGWQENLENFTNGFWDQEENTDNTLASIDGPKINKVYYNVDDLHGTENDNEWIELYNPNSFDINLKNWQVCDNNTCRYIINDTIISGLGFVVISNTTTTWNYWDIPSNIEKIQLSGSLFLGNTSDMILLKEVNNFVVDQMNWGTPTSTWSNYNINIWDPGAIVVEEGYMLGRVPVGFDINQASDFKNLGLPTVSVGALGGPKNFCGACNYTGPTMCAPVIIGTWPTNITWEAHNPNGNDNDLKIKLIYITDNDCSGTITDQDNSYVIASDIPNTGNYYWSGVFPVSETFVWIKVIVVGPENFMVQNASLTNPAFEPLPGHTKEVCSPLGDCWLEDINKISYKNECSANLLSQEENESLVDLIIDKEEPVPTVEIAGETTQAVSSEEAEILPISELSSSVDTVEQSEVEVIIESEPAIEPETQTVTPTEPTEPEKSPTDNESVDNNNENENNG